MALAFSFIRTVTVGPGIAPDLLTPGGHPQDGTGALAGSRPTDPSVFYSDLEQIK
jgi:hypothetical protein